MMNRMLMNKSRKEHLRTLGGKPGQPTMAFCPVCDFDEVQWMNPNRKRRGEASCGWCGKERDVNPANYR